MTERAAVSESLPIACTLRRDEHGVLDGDAWDIAREFVHLLRTVRAPAALFVLPDGGVAWSIGGNPDRDMLASDALSLVGIYTPETTAETVHDDIVAMPRGRVDAP